mgnify:CR=1 FL=1
MIRILSCSLLLMASLVVAPAAMNALDAADLPSAIENAKTAADHEALAAYYDGEAKAARAKAEEHRRMAGPYKKNPHATGGKGTYLPLVRSMPPHCDELAASYEAAAKDYEAMAAAHREAAKAAE